jgi:hypothetical protein
MHIGEIKEMCFHRKNVVLPGGYLECDGRKITEEEYPELFFHLSNDEEEVFLPVIDDIEIDDDLVLKKIIAYKDTVEGKVNYDGEFTTNNLSNRIFSRKDICRMRQDEKK